MTQRFIKTGILLGLVLLSIYQTVMLWFDYPSDRNFFYSVLDVENPITEQEENMNYDLFFPESIAVFKGRGKANYVVENITNSVDSNITLDSISAIRSAFNEGSKVDETIGMDDLWRRPHILLEMPFRMDSTLLRNNLQIESSWLLEGMAFDRVYIYPADYLDESILVIFTDDKLESRFGANIPLDTEKQLNDVLSRYMEEQKEEVQIEYISSKNNGISVFEEDTLLPVNGQQFDLLEELYSEISFYYGEERDVDEIRNFVNYFFINPENTWSTMGNNEIRFGDWDVLVKYNENGLFLYEIIEEVEAGNSSINASYDVALRFLEKDSLLNQVEYGLTNYEVTDQGVVFYFDYYYRGYPIVFEKIVSEYGQLHPMEITVVNNTVTTYKRLLYKTSEIVVQGNPFEVRFQNPIDELVAKEGEQKFITDMYLGYSVSDLSQGAVLKWVVEQENNRRLMYELE